MERMLKVHLVGEVRKHLISMIEEDLERIARESVRKYLEFNIRTSENTVYHNVVFNFVNKIINVNKQEIVIKEKTDEMVK